MITLKNIEPINTDRLILRGFNLNDAESLYTGYGKDIENTKYMLWRNYKDIEQAKKSIEYFIDCDNKNATFRQYAITLKDNTLIGQISFDINLRHHFASIAYVLDKNYQKQGYMKESINALVNYLFNELNCKRVEAEVMVDNKNSIELLKKCDFTSEGILRDKYINKEGNYTDIEILSIING